MLDKLPVEILEIIIGHLSTASSVLNLCLANQMLHRKISADKYELLKSFVQSRFPSIATPPFWRDAAIALTARSRAWDRRALIARECRVPEHEILPDNISPAGFKTGFVPAIDSYETWTGGTWAEKTEVFALGAAGRLSLRTTRNCKATWITHKTQFDHAPQNDIMDVRLLRPEQNRNTQGETIIFRRANNTVTKVISKAGKGTFAYESHFERDSKSLQIDSMDMNEAAEPLLAVCNAREVNLFQVESEDAKIEACDVLQLEHHHERKSRMRCVKFLSSRRLALGAQFLEGRLCAPIEIYEVSPSGLRPIATHIKDATLDPIVGRHCANAIVPLDATSTLVGRPGNVFLSGWTDGIVRMYDLRSSTGPTTEYLDTVDDGQILSLLPIGQEKFLAGGHHNACLKTFDLRMGARAYSYMNAPMPNIDKRIAGTSASRSNDFYTRHRDINIFLALNIPRRRRLWESLPQPPDPNMPRYRGAVYSLSSPSASSPTVYAGIESHVIQLDFVSTDDIRNSRISHLGMDLPSANKRTHQVLNLSCYERPQPGYEIFDPVLLRRQCEVANHWAAPGTCSSNLGNLHDKVEEGWDERWRLCTSNDSYSSSGWR